MKGRKGFKVQVDQRNKTEGMRGKKMFNWKKKGERVFFGCGEDKEIRAN